MNKNIIELKWKDINEEVLYWPTIEEWEKGKIIDLNSEQIIKWIIKLKDLELKIKKVEKFEQERYKNPGNAAKNAEVFEKLNNIKRSFDNKIWMLFKSLEESEQEELRKEINEKDYEKITIMGCWINEERERWKQYKKNRQKI